MLCSQCLAILSTAAVSATMAEATFVERGFEPLDKARCSRAVFKDCSDPVAAFQSVVSDVLCVGRAIDATMSAVLADQSASPPAASDFRQRIAAVCELAVSTHTDHASSTVISQSSTSSIAFPHIDRAFALLARRLQRPFHPSRPPLDTATVNTVPATTYHQPHQSLQHNSGIGGADTHNSVVQHEAAAEEATDERANTATPLLQHRQPAALDDSSSVGQSGGQSTSDQRAHDSERAAAVWDRRVKVSQSAVYQPTHCTVLRQAIPHSTAPRRAITRI